MSNTEEKKLVPNTEQMLGFLTVLFGDVPDGLIEVAYGPVPKNARLFTTQEIPELVKFAAERNSCGENIYFGASIRKPDTPRSRRCTKNDFYSAPGLWVDIDDQDAAACLNERTSDYPPDIIVTTGTVPNTRLHAYWRLLEPETDISRLEIAIETLGIALGGDPAVKNADRIMRLPGTISYPSASKQKRGYEPELTSFVQFFDVPEATTDEIIQAYGEAATVNLQVESAPSNDNRCSNGPLNLHDTVGKIMAGEKWHNNTVRLTGSLVTKGLSDDEILHFAPHLTNEGYTSEETRKEIQAMIDGARRKGFHRAPTVSYSGNAANFSYDVLRAHETPDWGDVTPIVDHFLYEDGFTMLYAREGCGKSAVAFNLCCAIATGGNFFGNSAARRPVLYIITERKRQFPRLLRGYCDEHCLDAVQVGENLFLTADYVDLSDAGCIAAVKSEIEKLESTKGQSAVIVIDSLYFAMGGGDIEKQKDVMMVTRSVLKSIIDAKPGRACMIVHHKGKSAGNEQFGSSAFGWVVDVKARIDKGENHVFQIAIEKNSYNDDAGRYDKRFRIVDTENGFGIRETEELAVVTEKRTPISELLFNALLELIDEEGRQLPSASSASEIPDVVVEHKRLKNYVRTLDIIKGDTAEQFAKNYSVHWTKLKKKGRVGESGPFVWPDRGSNPSNSPKGTG